MLIARLTSTPVMECESPMTMSCTAYVHGDPMELKFIGDFARSLKAEILSLRAGDMTEVQGLVRGGTILIQNLTLNNKLVGRNTNVYA